MKKTMLTAEQIADCLQSDGDYWGRVQERASWYDPDAQGLPVDEMFGPELYIDLSELNRQYGLPPAVDRVVCRLLLDGDPGDLGSWWDDTVSNRLWGNSVYLDEGRLAQVTWAMTVHTPACEKEQQCQECPDCCQWEADSEEYDRLLSDVELASIEDGPSDTSDLADTAQLIEVDGDWYLRYATTSMKDGVVTTEHYWFGLPFLPRSPAALEEVEIGFELWEPISSGFAGTVKTIDVPGPLDDQSPSRSVFRMRDEVWEISFKGRPSFFLKHIDGLAYLRYLLAAPYFDFAATHLSALVKKYGPGAPLAMVVDPDEDEDDRPYHIKDLALNQEQLDDQARQEYRQRIMEIERQRLRAHQVGDKETESKLVEERKKIEGVLYAAEGFGHKARYFPDPGSRSRIAITQAIGRAKAKIEQKDALLRAYLDLTIDTGTRMVYHPDPSQEIEWDT